MDTKFYEFALTLKTRGDANIFVLGIPFEGEVNTRKGAYKGPGAIRIASDIAESYSHYFKRELESYKIWDDGDLDVPEYSSQKEKLIKVTDLVRERLPENVIPVFLGGDHAVSLPLIKVMHERFPNLEIVHLDAHSDCQDSFLGEKYCYAAVMRRVSEFISPERIYQLGIRTGIRDEYEYCENNTNFYPLTRESFKKSAEIIAAKTIGKPLYVSIDIDVLDPSIAPGTSNPVCAGIDMSDMRHFIKQFQKHKIIGIDLVEVSPEWDPAQITALVASEILRDCILGWFTP